MLFDCSEYGLHICMQRVISTLSLLTMSDSQERLTAAVEVARKLPVQHLEGDAVTRIRDAFVLIPAHELVVVFHSFVCNQFPEAVRQQLSNTFRELASTRDFLEIGVEFLQHDKAPLISVTRWTKQGNTVTIIAECNAHGSWLKCERK